MELTRKSAALTIQSKPIIETPSYNRARGVLGALFRLMLETLLVLAVAWFFLPVFLVAWLYYLYLKGERYAGWVLAALSIAFFSLAVYAIRGYVFLDAAFTLFLVGAFASLFLAYQLAVNPYLRRGRVVGTGVFEVDGRRYEYSVVDLDEANAWAARRGGWRLYVSRRLLEVLDGEELKAVLLHEVGHTKGWPWTIAYAVGMYAWLFVTSFTLIPLAYVQLKGLSAENSLLLSYFLLASLLVVLGATVASWLGEHEADAYAAEKASPDTVARALAKTDACNRLRELCRKEVVEHVAVPSYPEPRLPEVLREALASVVAYIPWSILHLAKILKTPFRTHPPLKLRVYAVLASSRAYSPL
ncbi:M48 family metallopeptidase [Thermofilum pendens]